MLVAAVVVDVLVHAEDVRIDVRAIAMAVTVLVLTTVVVPDATTVLVHVKVICLVGGADVETIAKTTVVEMVVMENAVVVVVLEIVTPHVVVVLLTVAVAVARVSEEDVLAIVLVPPIQEKVTLELHPE